jgi:hypothetical protein
MMRRWKDWKNLMLASRGEDGRVGCSRRIGKTVVGEWKGSK